MKTESTVYRLQADSDRFQNLVPMDDNERAKLEDRFDGTWIGNSWVPVRVRVLRGPNNEGLPAGDFPSLGGVVPVFSLRAIDGLRDLLEPCGELLPLEIIAGDYVAFNTTAVLDALDSERSSIVRFRSSGRVMDIERYAFKPEALGTASIFKLPETRWSRTYVDQAFVDRVEGLRLTGFDFRRVWTLH
jgi:hypothetical protein